MSTFAHGREPAGASRRPQPNDGVRLRALLLLSRLAWCALSVVGPHAHATAQPVSYLSGVAETVQRLADPNTPTREHAQLSAQVVARGPGAVPLLIGLGQSSDVATRVAALKVLSQMPLADFGLGGVTQQLLPLFTSDAEGVVRVAAAAALGATRDPAALDALRQAAENESRDIRQAAVQALGQLNRVETIPVLTRAARDRDIAVRGAALRGLFDLKAVDALRLIQPTVTDPATSDTVAGYLSMLESESMSTARPAALDVDNAGAQDLVRRILIREQRSLRSLALFLIALPGTLGAARVFFKGSGRRVQFVATLCFVVVATPLAIWLTGFRSGATPRETLGLDVALPFPESLLLLPTVVGATFVWTRLRGRLVDLLLHAALWTLGHIVVRSAVAAAVPALLGAWTLTNAPLTQPLGPGWRDTVAVALLVLLASSIRQFGSPEHHSKRMPRLSLPLSAFAWSLGLSVVMLSTGYVILGIYIS